MFLGSWVSIWGKTDLGFHWGGANVLRLKWVKCWLQILLSGGKGYVGVFRKMKWVKGGLMGPGSRACHVIDDFVYYNSILATGGNGDAIGCK